MVATMGYVLTGHLGDMKSIQNENATQNIQQKALETELRALQNIVARNTGIIDTLMGREKNDAFNPSAGLQPPKK